MLNKRKCIFYFTSGVCVLQNEYFSIVKSFKYYSVVGSVIIGSVGWWVGGVGGSVRKLSVVGWSVVGGLDILLAVCRIQEYRICFQNTFKGSFWIWKRRLLLGKPPFTCFWEN